MPATFYEDIEYLGKVILLTFMLVSGLVIYNQKFLEGIILLSFCVQIFLLWSILKKHDISEIFSLQNPKTKPYEMQRYLHLSVSIILFIIALFYLFRALAIIQQSFINYGTIKTSWYDEIYFTSIIGIIIFIIFIALIVFGKKYFDRINTRILLPIIFFKICIYLS